MALHSALSTLSRYEALFELTSEINAAAEIEEVGQHLARRLKYVVDSLSWRYLSLDAEDSPSLKARRMAMVIDGHRGQATVDHVPVDRLCELELDLWTAKKSRFVEGEELASARPILPEQFQSEAIVQIHVSPRFADGELRSILLFGKQRQPFTDLEIKFLSLASEIFDDKVYRLWEQRRLRELELAYLQQEITLRQNEKLATLGKMSAGMAHELNNPAAAAQRGAERLGEEIARLERSLRSLGEMGISGSQSAAFEKLAALTRERAASPTDLDPLARSDLESEIEIWLEDRGLDEPWEVAPSLATIGLDGATLTALGEEFTADQLPAVVASLSSSHTTRSLTEEIREGAGRIAEIVKALKSYTYLDQAPIQTIDLHEGLNDTLTMLRSRLKEGITVRRELDPELPRIQAFGSELNQVWTNIVDNAIAAMDGSGELLLRTYHDPPWAVVEIEDTGPGIPEEIQGRIYDPFFTTKPPGEGTGLGLNITHNIVVQRHKGRIEVRSEPGSTCFRVRLPLNLPTETPER